MLGSGIVAIQPSRSPEGFGTNPSGDTEGWIAVIPEPNAGLLLMNGLLGLAWYRRGRVSRVRC